MSMSRLPHLHSGDADAYLSPRVLMAKTTYSVALAISVYLYQSTAEKNRNKKWRVLRTFHFPMKTQLHFFAPGFHEALLHSSKRVPFLFTLSQVSSVNL